MRRPNPFLTIGLGIVFLFGAFSCAGTKARENVLLPAMRLAWPGVKEDATVALPAVADRAVTESAISAMDFALSDGSISVIVAVNWEVIRTAANLGITIQTDRGDIGPGVADSLRERVINFDNAMNQMRTTR